MNQSPNYRNFRILFFIYIIFIMYAAFTPHNIPIAERFSDKLNHLLAFFLLSILFEKAFGFSFIIRTLLILAFGFLIELIQYFLPYRQFSLVDMGADAAGIMIYYVFKAIISRFARKNEV